MHPVRTLISVGKSLPASALVALLLTGLVQSTGCGNDADSGWPGTFRQVPFSHDLTLLGYDGWSYTGTLPRRARKAEVIGVQIWHEAFDGVIEPEPIVSHQPDAGTLHGAWSAKDRPIRNVRIDLLLTRRMDGGLPKHAYRAVINGVQQSKELEVPEGSRFKLEFLPPESGKLALGEPILIGEAIIEGYSQRKGDETLYTMNRRTFKWYALFEAEFADD